ncbi:MAG: hypothetical protein EXS63_04375 [Candidatus Omnitrophica bacterium]|nr:hypothetical protein [Candidatus Omnitrophota bacterium]
MADKDKNKDPKDQDSMTPEEKLFRVITGGRNFDLGPDDQDGSQDDLIEISFLTRLETWISQSREIFGSGASQILKHFETRLQGFSKKSNVQVHSFSDLIQIKSINRVLMVLVILMTLYLVFDFVFFRVSWIGALNPSSNSMLTLNAPALVKTELSRYTDKAEKRNVFVLPPPPEKTAQEKLASKVQDLEKASQAAAIVPSTFKLVGVSWDDHEYVAMIELDSTKQEGARIVRKGDFLGDGIKVEEIKEFSVFLSKGSQKWELA